MARKVKNIEKKTRKNASNKPEKSKVPNALGGLQHKYEDYFPFYLTKGLVTIYFIADMVLIT